MVENTHNLNIDAKTLSQCLKSTSNFGNTVYNNICTGESSVVNWGGVDWAFCIFLILLGLGVLIFAVAFSRFLWDEL